MLGEAPHSLPPLQLCDQLFTVQALAWSHDDTGSQFMLLQVLGQFWAQG